ncbi:MAG: FG-GAP-like repeat-containing protein [Bacteroidota bacterium]
MAHQNNPLLSLIKRKRNKYQYRLRKSIRNGFFSSLSSTRKNTLVAKTQKFTSRLNRLKWLGKPAMAGSVAAGLVLPSTGMASPAVSDLAYKNDHKVKVHDEERVGSIAVERGQEKALSAEDAAFVNGKIDGDADFSRTFAIQKVSTATRIQANNMDASSKGGRFNTESIVFDNSSYDDVFIPVDYDGDGDTDMLRSNNEMMVNTGVNFVKQTLNIVPSSGAREVSFIDVDEDGDLDALAISEGNRCHLAINDNNESFSYSFVGNASFGLATGDFDNDELEDVAFIHSPRAGDVAFFWFEVDAGRATSQQDIPLQLASGGGLLGNEGTISDLEVVDLNGDEFDDLILMTETGTNPGNDFLFLGSASGFSTTPTALNFPEDNGLNQIEVRDLDQDGDVDILSQRFVNGEGRVGIDVHLNDGTGTFTLHETLELESGSGDTDFVVGDVDGDGRDDIVASYEYYDADYSTNGIRRYEVMTWSNQGDGSFSQAQTLSDGINGYEIELMDVDNDQDLDLLVKDADDPFSLRIFQNENQAPTEIALSATAFDEEIALDTEVATITVTDINPNDTHVISLISGDGSNDAHNSFFDVDGDKLILTKFIDFETINLLNIYLSADDGNGNTLAQAFTLSVNDVEEPQDPEEPLGLSEEANALGIYPNPGVNEIQLNVTNDFTGEIIVRVLDLNGKLIQSISSQKKKENWTGTLDMTEANAGVYVVEVALEDHLIVQRWMKE